MEILNVLFLTLTIKNLDNNKIFQLDILFKSFVQHLVRKNSPKPISWQNLQNYSILQVMCVGFSKVQLQF
jgi:hypothetical protein